MKKTMSILVILTLIGISTYYFLFSAIIPAQQLNALTINHHEDSALVMTMSEDEESIERLLNAINKGVKVGRPSTFQQDYTLKANYSSKDAKSFILDFDLATQQLTLQHVEKDKFYIIKAEDSLSLFTSTHFKDIYPNSIVPQLTLKSQSIEIMPEESKSEWSYKMINEEWESLSTSEASLEDQTYSTEKATEGLKLSYDLQPDSILVEVWDEDSLIEEVTPNNNEFLPYPSEGTYHYIVISQWDNATYKGQRFDTFKISLNLPVAFTVSKSTATAGDFIVVYADNVDLDERLFIDQNLIKATPAFYPNGKQFMAFIPLNYWAKNGQYKIALSSDKIDADPSLSPTTIDVKIKSKDFKKQYLYVDESIDKATRNDDAYAQYAKYFNPSRDVITSEKLWEGPFINPVEGRISTEFGEMRYVNDALTSYRHSGTDYAVPKGTPIKAPNNGRVNLSMFLTLTGNTIVIDHGMGLFSVYFHLDSLSVEKDQMVVKGDIIGTVGSTGFSTGPHLHYTTSIGKVNFDSLLLTDYDPSLQ